MDIKGMLLCLFGKHSWTPIYREFDIAFRVDSRGLVHSKPVEFDEYNPRPDFNVCERCGILNADVYLEVTRRINPKGIFDGKPSPSKILLKQ